MPARRLPRFLLSVALLASPLAIAASPPELELVRGGALQADPVADGALVHVPTGRVLSTWDHGDAAAPRLASTTDPVDGIINGVVRHGDYLYASYRNAIADGGLAVYSLADPAAPALVADIRDYSGEPRRQAAGVAIGNGRLFVFDRYLGIFVADLDDPARPELRRTSQTTLPAEYRRITAVGDTLHATGRTLLGMTVLHVFDVSNPDAPRLVANHQFNGATYQNLVSEGARVFGYGSRLTLFDLEDPAVLVPRGDVASPPAFIGVRFGDHLHTFGAGPGLDVWDIADPDAPTALGNVDIPTLGTRRWLAHDDTLFLPSELDRLQAIDMREPATPTLRSTAWLPGGSAARDVARHGDHLVLLQPDYGLSINDPDTLEQVGRFDAELPEQLAERSFQQMAVRGDIAYLAAWGYGLFTVDISDPEAPVELGRAEFPRAATIALHGNLAYVTRSTNSRDLAVFDIADPSAPRLLQQFVLPAQVKQLQVEGDHLYLAEARLASDAGGTGGLRILDISDPLAPVQVARVGDDCHSAHDFAIDAEVSLLHLACRGGLQVVDIADPAQPAVVARHAIDETTGEKRIVQRGDRAWFASITGLYPIDLSDPTAPVAGGPAVPLGGYEPERLMLLDDRLLALGGTTGVHAFVVGEDAVMLENREPVGGLAGEAGSSRLFAIEVPAGAAALQVLSYGGRGNVALHVRHGAPPTADVHDAASDRPGNNESIRIAAPAAGTWYLRIGSADAFSGVSVQARY
ncbi:pre-peptidase C-terminal domain-containing protein [Luteimonas sp. BDR2-5]|uniref:pre-peptidase C-terminal domain-containing protein n=1 Tax=Proluteimonas luteida TaxID=2878685 RepID=UPI001E5138C9|nr:pre-peptidase C-terminal domain-containing protein [Luteimonas sp. BDR2-5]MCD9029547.1 pre-peptidase C-terminal domain-containing protein [Luteimonas sp. BDR2-5]